MTNHLENQYLVPWKLGDVLLGTALIGIGSLIAVTVLRPIVGFIAPHNPSLLTPWIIGIMEGLMLLAVWIFGVNKYQAGWHTLGLKKSDTRWGLVLPWIALIGSLGFASLYMAVVTFWGLEFLQPSPIPEEILHDRNPMSLHNLIIVVWSPFTEELFFRGFVLAALIPYTGIWRAVVISSAIFAAAHLMVSTLVPIFVTGLFLSWLYLKCRSIWPPLTAHIAQNFLVLTLVS